MEKNLQKSKLPIVLGVLSLITWIIPLIGIIVSIIGTIISKKNIKLNSCKLYKTAFILNIIGIVLASINFVTGIYVYLQSIHII